MPVLGERFYQMSNTIFCYDLKPIPLAVYSYLVCCAGQKDVCWPSMKTIALHCGCSENAARDAVSLLVDCGFISIRRTAAAASPALLNERLISIWTISAPTKPDCFCRPPSSPIWTVG